MSSTHILDASALLGYIYGKDGYDEVEEILRSKALITTLQLGEVYYVLLQEEGREKAQSALASIKNANIDLVPIGEGLAIEAGEIKVRTGMPYVDSIVAGLANTEPGTLVTSDKDFERLESHYEIELNWVGED